MLGCTTGAFVTGIDAHPVRVEVYLGGGLPTVSAVGLPDAGVREGIDRIAIALRQSGYDPPARRVVVNFSPADVRKHGAALDLPIAVALLAADGRLEPSTLEPLMLAAEVGLDGSLRPIRGALPFALAARDAGKRTLVVAAENAAEAGLVDGLEVVAARTLADAVAACRGERGAATPEQPVVEPERAELPDLCEVRAQPAARRALEVAAAGGHHLLLVGPPGSGKTMLARRMPGILPPLSRAEAIEVTRVWSVAGIANGLVAHPPFRAPHHGISFAALTGGGRHVRPGEISLANRGVLFLDELPEFRRDALEALRQPLEDGEITVVRVHGAATFPARFTLVASMNPCPCGYRGTPGAGCRCTPREVARYRARVSGPLLDRFDLICHVPACDLERIGTGKPGESSARVRARIVEARERQRRRFGAAGPGCNARMGPAELGRHARLSGPGRRMILAAAARAHLSARGFDRVRRVARTLADLEGEPTIAPGHLAEALQYRLGRIGP